MKRARCNRRLPKYGWSIETDSGEVSAIKRDDGTRLSLAHRLMATREAARSVGVQPSNFVRDWASRPDFPAPLATLSSGRIWLGSDVEQYAATRRAPKPGGAHRADRAADRVVAEPREDPRASPGLRRSRHGIRFDGRDPGRGGILRPPGALPGPGERVARRLRSALVELLAPGPWSRAVGAAARAARAVSRESRLSRFSHLPVLEPKTGTLPAEQVELWPRLFDVPEDFVLYGGTGLSLIH